MSDRSADPAHRALQVGFLYEWALDRGAYGYRFSFEPDDDMADLFTLATSLLQHELELRRREWDALELLLAYVPPGGRRLDPDELPQGAMHAAYRCGWLGKPPNEEDL